MTSAKRPHVRPAIIAHVTRSIAAGKGATNREQRRMPECQNARDSINTDRQGCAPADIARDCQTCSVAHTKQFEAAKQSNMSRGAALAHTPPASSRPALQSQPSPAAEAIERNDKTAPTLASPMRIGAGVSNACCPKVAVTLPRHRSSDKNHSCRPKTMQ